MDSVVSILELRGSKANFFIKIYKNSNVIRIGHFLKIGSLDYIIITGCKKENI